MRWKFLLALVAAGMLALPLAAQNPTGTLSGRVTSEEGDALPGVTVTVASPSLQGTQTTATSGNGGYIFRFLPPGEYTVTFELSGFAKAERSQKISAAQSSQIDVTMALEAVTEEILVTGAFETLSTTPQANTTYEKVFLEKLPVDRDIRSAVVLTPGVATTGPADNIVISGAMSYENLFMVNGVVLNENIRGQPFDLFIEDAIQETTTTTSGVSAEYGRFAGGVVNVITKSGGNQFEGSLRVNYTNEDWEATRPDDTEVTDKVNDTYEGTFGGYLWKDRVWFFLAGRDFEQNQSEQTAAPTRVAFANNDTERRYEGKLTFSLAEGHRLIGSYMEIKETDGGNFFGSVLDTASVVDRELPQDLLAFNYTGVLTSNFFVEAQYSERHFTFVDSGSLFTDRIRGTLFVDRITGSRWHSPTFCGACDPDEERNNENILAKGSWFLSSEKLGSHDIVFGYDSYNDIRLADNHQSGSDFRILLSGTIVGSDGVSLFPILRPGTSGAATIIQYNPIAVTSKGTEFITNSYFVNDAWRFSDRLTFNVGLRYDVNDGTDAEGKKVVNDAKLSPRLSASFDLKGDGDWIFNAAYAEYVTAIANSQADATSRGGVPGTVTWWYQGPAVNTGGSLVDADTALQTLWDWFDSTGNINNPNIRSISIPGGNSVISDTLASPSTVEYTLGVTKRLGSRGLVRADYVRREGEDFYVDRRDLTTGQVTLPNGTRADLSVVENENDLLERVYDGLHTSFRYRLTDKLDLGGNWTFSHLRGNINGETRASGPVRSGIRNYPEYFDVAWFAPNGDLSSDQRHRVRLWGTYDVFNTSHHGLSLGLLQSYFSGRPYGAAGAVDTRPYVTNPGYRTPPTAVGYFFTDRDAFHTPDIYATDFSLNYSFKWGAFGRDLEVFVQPEILNIFNEQNIATTDVNFFDTSVCDATTAVSATCPGSYVRFNPFTEVPVEGVHWAKGTNFGGPLLPEAYQTPRTFRVSLGIRF
jgi:outer membrane receptor protein involved in Fe transport